MKTELVLEILLLALNNTARLSALYQTAVKEGRDLTPEEVVEASLSASAANEALMAAITA